MKHCMIVRITDKSPVKLHDWDDYVSEHFPKMEAELEVYLEEGYEVKQIVPHVAPEIQEDGKQGFCETGYTFYLERETDNTLQSDFEEFLNEAFGQMLEDGAQTYNLNPQSKEEERSFLAKYGDKIPFAVPEYVGDSQEEETI